MSLLKNIISNSYKIYDEIQNYDLDMLKKSTKIRMTKISISKKHKSLIHHGIILGIYCEEAQTVQIEIGYNLIYEVKLQPNKINFIYDDYVFPVFLLTHHEFRIRVKHSKLKAYIIYYDINEEAENHILTKNDNDTCIHLDKLCFYAGLGGFFIDKRHNYSKCESIITSYSKWKNKKIYEPKIIYI